MSIEIRAISKRFGGFVALDDINLQIPTGELVALLGPSGCGKTTLLRIIAGMESADAGQVLFAGEEATHVHARDRNVGFVFQHYALFRHMSVFENVAFGLRVKPRKVRPSAAEIRQRVNDLLKLVQLDWLADRYPSQLSGGQRQRIALARALAVEPRVLLLDEPFGALDTRVRKELRRWLRRLHDEMHISSVFVTHDQEEALEVADRVVVMNQAKVEQIGTPYQVFHQPASEFVMDFLGNVNVFQGRIEKGRALLGGLSLEVPGLERREASSANVYVRPHEWEIERQRNGTPAIEALVTRINPAGSSAKVLLSVEGERELHVDLPFERFLELNLQHGETVYVCPKRVRVFLPTPDYAPEYMI